MRRRGLTLIEAIVSTAVVATLVALVLPAIVGQIDRGDPARVRRDVITLRDAVTLFASDVRQLPSTIVQLATTNGRPPGFDLDGAMFRMDARGPYLEHGLSYVELGGTGVAVRTFRRGGGDLECRGQIIAPLTTATGAPPSSEAVAQLESILDGALGPGGGNAGLVRYASRDGVPDSAAATLCVAPIQR